MSQSSLKKIGILLVGIIVFFLPYERIPSLDILGGGITIRLSQLFGLALWGIGLITFNWKVLYKEIKQLPTFQKLLALYIFSSFLSVLLAAYDLRRAIVVWLFTTFTIGVGFWISRFFRENQIDEYKKYLAATTWVVVVFGIYQFIGDIVGLSNSLTGLRDLYTNSVLGFTRVQSVGLEPLYFASFLFIPLMIFVADYLLGNKPRLALIFVTTLTVALTVSRGAYIGGLAAMLALFILVYFSAIKVSFIKILTIFATLFFAVISAFAMMSYIKPVQNDKPAPDPSTAVVKQATNLDSQDDRVRNRKLATQLFGMNPVLGAGPGNFDMYARQLTPVYQELPGYVIVNNQVLETLSETGIVGLILLLSSMGLLIFKAFIDIRKQKDATIVALEIGLMAFLVSLAVQYQTFSTLYIMHVWVAIGLLMGAVIKPEKAINKGTRAVLQNKKRV